MTEVWMGLNDMGVIGFDPLLLVDVSIRGEG